MKIRKMVRYQMVLAGLAAAMFFAPSAHSQEITNSTFDDGPNVTTMSQPSAAQPSVQQVAVQPDAAAKEIASIQGSLEPSNTASMDSPWVAGGLTVILLTGVAVAAIGESKRKRNSYAARREPSYRNA